jgi:hypothetical protein
MYANIITNYNKLKKDFTALENRMIEFDERLEDLE